MERFLVVFLVVVLMIGCGSSGTVQAKDTMFDEYRVDNEHVILVDRDTKVCNLQYGSTRNNITGETYSGITIMLNADGTPKLWEE